MPAKVEIVRPRTPGIVSPEDFIRFQTNILRVLNTLLDLPILNFKQLTNQALIPTKVNLVETGLGRPYQGYIITKNNAATPIYQKEDGVDKSRYLPLVVTVACTVDIYVW